MAEKRFYNFGMILYPNEDIRHRRCLKYFAEREEYKAVWIEHTRDGEYGKTEYGENIILPKKPHVHLLVRLRTAKTQLAFQKFVCVWINHVEGIHYADDYINYMLHQTPMAIEDPTKSSYNFLDIFGDAELIEQAQGRTRDYIYLEQIGDFYNETSVDNVLDIYNMLVEKNGKDQRETITTFLRRYQGLICTSSNQAIKKQIREYNLERY